jgi:hypothetical protein
LPLIRRKEACALLLIGERVRKGGEVRAIEPMPISLVAFTSSSGVATPNP